MGRKFDVTKFHEKNYRARTQGQKRWGTGSFDSDYRPRPGEAPEEIVRGVMEWLDGRLSPMIKKAINFDANPKGALISLVTNADYAEVRRGTIHFGETGIKVSACKAGSAWGLDDWTVEVNYADPDMFEQLVVLLSRFYNGK